MGRCPEHRAAAKRVADAARPSATARGYTWRWRRYVGAYKIEHPLCRSCQADGRLTATQCVDHVDPVAGADDPKFWDPGNHQPLCHACHSRKTAAEDGGFGNAPASARGGGVESP